MNEDIKILFVCTDNFTRSVTAEMCLNDYAKSTNMDIRAGSAGINASSDVSNYLSIHFERMNSLGIDVSTFKRSHITKEIINEYDIIVGMADEHKEYFKNEFNLDIPTFTDICDDSNYNTINFILNDIEAFIILLNQMVEYFYQVMPSFVDRLIDRINRNELTKNT